MRDEDATIRLPTAHAPVSGGAGKGTPPRTARRTVVVAGFAAAALVASAVAWAWLWFALRPAPQPPDKPETPTIATRPVAPLAVAPPLASEAEILANRASVPMLFSLSDNPRVFVLDLPDLDAQGAMLNRAAALIEKTGQPRDRVLDDTALAAAIAGSGDTPATYYYGHNYRGSDLERFFALAARDGIALTPGEAWLRDQVARIRLLVPAPQEFAVVSVPGLDERVDQAMRRAILHHEIAHGHFFTNAPFAENVARVWREVFTAPERAAFSAFLAREGYDPSIEEVMMNEAMAYLLYTPDARFFTPAHAGLSEARAAELREALRVVAPL